jgi:hypothetical protein
MTYKLIRRALFSFPGASCKGSTFSMDVPLAQESTLTAIPMASGIPTSGERALAVLFIDNDAAVADSLSMLLTGAGFCSV